MGTLGCAALIVALIVAVTCLACWLDRGALRLKRHRQKYCPPDDEDD